MKHNRKLDDAVLLDMNISLVAAAERLIHDHHVVPRVTAIIDDWPSGVDKLLQDGGATTNDYRATAEGYLRDRYAISGRELDAATDTMVKDAIAYLKKNPGRFDNV
jgi:hypothetical protein